MQEAPRDNAIPVPPLEGDVAPSKLPWGKLAAVVLLILVIIAGIAVVVRPQNHPPTISRATVSATSGAVGDLFAFTAEASDPDSDALAHLWDFGDGTTSTAVQSRHAYAIPGQFIALLTVSDGKGGEVTNDPNLLSIRINPKSSTLTVPPCKPADVSSNKTCAPGPVVAVLSADGATAVVGAMVAFNGNASWAYAFSWANSSNHSWGGRYSVDNASRNSSLFAVFRYVWGDRTDNTTGTSDAVGRTAHWFAAPGNYFVRLTVTYLNAALNPPTKTASAGYTVRVRPAALSSYSFAEGTLGTFEGRPADAGILSVAWAIRFD